MKRALITGGEGFVGSHLWIELKKHGYDVYGTSLSDLGVTNDHVLICDITSPERLNEVVSEIRPDYIFHLAGQASPSRSWQYPQKTIEINTIGTVNLFESVKLIPNYNPRIVVVGSAAEYGTVPEDELPITEESFIDPKSPYAVSKLACYHLSLAYFKAYEMEIVYAAAFNHTGPGQAPGFIGPDIASQIVKIERGEMKPELITGNLDTLRDYTDVRDVVRAYRLLAEAGKAGERYNICSGVPISTRRIFETLTQLSKVKIIHLVDPEKNNISDTRVIVGSHEKITKHTGWKPEIEIEKTLEDLLEWYRNKDK